jgi:hypothetical protein
MRIAIPAARACGAIRQRNRSRSAFIAHEGPMKLIGKLGVLVKRARGNRESIRVRPWRIKQAWSPQVAKPVIGID